MKLPIGKRLLGIGAALAVGAASLVGVQGMANADPTPLAKPPAVSGTQQKPPVAAGDAKVMAKKMAPKGATKLIKTDAAGKPDASYLAGYVANVDFNSPLYYCAQGFAYHPVRNVTASTKYLQVRIYANGSSSDFYTSVAANSTAYPYFYGLNGAYSAYLYVWNGSSYVYDEYWASNLNCNVSVSLTNYGSGYVYLTIRNNGNAYASVLSNELAPYPVVAAAPSGYGSYVGAHWDYPATGGGVIYRYKYVGTNTDYGIYVDLYGALYYSPWYWWRYV